VGGVFFERERKKENAESIPPTSFFHSATGGGGEGKKDSLRGLPIRREKKRGGTVPVFDLFQGRDKFFGGASER